MIRQLCLGLLACLVIVGLVSSAPAITINSTFHAGGWFTDVTGADDFSVATGKANQDQTFQDVFNAAADWWESALPGDFTLDLNYFHDDLTASYGSAPTVNALHIATSVDPVSGRENIGTIAFDFDRPWFFDTTPLIHSEFNMGTTLYSSLIAGHQAAFGGTVPANLVVGVTGGATDADAMNPRIDLMTVALHEIGHAVGMAIFDAVALPGETSLYSLETADGDIDIAAALFGGASGFSIDTIGSHLAPAVAPPPFPALMWGAIVPGERRLPSELDILAIQQVSGFNVVPEPGTIALFGLGAFGLVGLARSRRRRRAA